MDDKVYVEFLKIIYRDEAWAIAMQDLADGVVWP